MASIIYIAGFLIIIFYLAYLYVKSGNYKMFDILEATRIQLVQSQQAELQLKEQIRLLEERLHRTFEDPITHLLGWQIFEDRLNQSLKDSARYQFNLSILVVDISDFKMVNSALGYEAGDDLLKEIAIRLQACVRQVDSLTRFSKDTFIILLVQLAKPETTVVVTQRILESLAQPFKIHEQETYINAHIGIAVYPADGENATSLIKSADQALQIAKTQGRHVYQFYQKEMNINSQRELLLHSSLNQETVLQEFIMYYRRSYK